MRGEIVSAYPLPCLQTHCDISPSEGAWTSVLRRLWSDHDRTYQAISAPSQLSQYMQGLGYTREEFWIGGR